MFFPAISLKNLADNSVNSAEFCIFKFFLFLSHVSCNSAEFFWFLMNFSDFLKI
jgi:hypothetical protein